MPDFWTDLSTWLMDQTLADADLENIILGLVERLRSGGVPIARLSVGRTVLHPSIGLIDMQYKQGDDRVTINYVSRAQVRGTMDKNSPFAELSRTDGDEIIADLTDRETRNRFPIFKTLAEDNVTGYVAFTRRFGLAQPLHQDIATGFRGASVSFATRRLSGFTAEELCGLRQIVTPLCTNIRIANEHFVTTKVAEAYLGRISSRQVLAGSIERGDGQNIDCAIFYTDMRGSLPMSQSIGAQDYLATVNTYFECCATSVTDHGGEVLKFIGDGMLAIFPTRTKGRNSRTICAAALASAREALLRAEHANALRAQENLPKIDFGIALHLGAVIWGNVGTPERLDFTATGPEVGIAARLEGLNRALGSAIVASESFANALGASGTSTSTHKLRGLQAPLTVHTFNAEPD